jgi:hypothetical protein
VLAALGSNTSPEACLVTPLRATASLAGLAGTVPSRVMRMNSGWVWVHACVGVGVESSKGSVVGLCGGEVCVHACARAGGITFDGNATLGRYESSRLGGFSAGAVQRFKHSCANAMRRGGKQMRSMSSAPWKKSWARPTVVISANDKFGISLARASEHSRSSCGIKLTGQMEGVVRLAKLGPFKCYVCRGVGGCLSFETAIIEGNISNVVCTQQHIAQIPQTSARSVGAPFSATLSTRLAMSSTVRETSLQCGTRSSL